MNENNQSQRSDESRKTKLFAISIGAVLILLSIAALAIMPSIKEASQKDRLSELKQQYDDLLSSKFRSSVDASIKAKGYNRDALTKEQLETLYDACRAEITRSYNFDESKSIESQVTTYENAISNLDYQLGN